MEPSLGRVILYRSKTGRYTLPALITSTARSLNPDGVAAGALPDLSSPLHVHLTVFTPGRKGQRIPGSVIPDGRSPHGIEDPWGGSYQEWDIEPSLDAEGFVAHRAEDVVNNDFAPGTWAWPLRQPS